MCCEFVDGSSRSGRIATTCHMLALSIEKLTILAGRVAICAKILLMPCGICIGVLLSRLISSSHVRRWLLSFKVPVIYK